MSEKDFLQQVTDLACMCGWLVFHPFDSRRSAPGYPDVTFVHPQRGQFFLAELKSERGRLSQPQVRWIAALAHAGVEVHVWRPADLDGIARRLAPTTTNTY